MQLVERRRHQRSHGRRRKSLKQRPRSSRCIRAYQDSNFRVLRAKLGMSSLRSRKKESFASAAPDEGVDPSGKQKHLQESDRTARVVGKTGKNTGIVALIAMISLALAVHDFQTVRLPQPLSAEEAGIRRFSEERAFGHLTVLTSFGPKPVGSEKLDHALEYVFEVLESIKNTANPNVIVEVENFHSESGMNRLKGGVFKGKTLLYADLHHALVRLSSKYSNDAEDNAILVSSHVDTVYTSSGGGDCGSCVSVMLELVRALSQSAQSFKHSVIFLFNTGEEEGLNGAHSFITQHPWNSSVRTFVDLEAMGAGGKSYLFQAGPDKWLVDVFARTAKYPAANILAQDVFHAGLFKSATDFQIYREVAGLSGLDFAYIENGATYHTRNDDIKLVRPGSLQQLGDNMLPLLAEVASSTDLANLKTSAQDSKMEMVYFDVLGGYMVTFTHEFAKMLYSSILLQSLLLFAGSLVRAESFAVPALAIAALGVLLTWIFAVAFVVGVAALLPFVSAYSVPFIAHPFLAVGLFGSSAFFGGVLGHSVGHRLLHDYLKRSISGSSTIVDAEAEKSMFKAVFLQWLLVLGLGVWSGAGSSYIAVAWLVLPAIAYGIKESSLSKNQASKQLSVWTLLLGLPLPVVLSADMFLNLPSSLIGNLVRLERHPGGISPWLGNAVIGVVIAVIVCFSVSYLLPYFHRKGDKLWILLLTALIFNLSLAVASYEFLPAFTSDIGKGTYVVHVIEAKTNQSSSESYVSVSFTTPGGPEKEVQSLVENGFVCGSVEKPDLVNFKVRKGCTKAAVLDEELWRNRPELTILSDRVVDDQNVTSVLLNSAMSHRWSLAIDTNKIEALQIDTVADETSGGRSLTLVPRGSIVGEDGWHHLQFSSGRNGPRRFNVQLIWQKDSVNQNSAFLKLRTDVNVLTQDASSALQNLPHSCVVFGKSTSPFSLAYLLVI